jgi:hypothetical protein
MGLCNFCKLAVKSTLGYLLRNCRYIMTSKRGCMKTRRSQVEHNVRNTMQQLGPDKAGLPARPYNIRLISSSIPYSRQVFKLAAHMILSLISSGLRVAANAASITSWGAGAICRRPRPSLRGPQEWREWSHCSTRRCLPRIFLAW